MTAEPDSDRPRVPGTHPGPGPWRRSGRPGPAKILFVLLLAALLVLIVLEIAVRFTAPEAPWLPARYVELSEDLPELDELVAEAGWGPGDPPRYYPEYLYAAAPVEGEHINFTAYYSARLTPDSVPLAEAEHIVWAFGGSTLENTETTDSLSIANTWARVFNERLGPTHVKNFGTGGFFSSLELIKFQRLLREVPAAERATLAVFYDGYNDAVYGFQYGAGSMQGDLSLKLRALVERRYGTLWAYSSSRLLQRASQLWARTAVPMLDQWLFPLGEPRGDAANLAATVRVYTDNAQMIKASCRMFGIRCLFVLQPLLMTKQPLSALEREVLDALEAHRRFGPEGVEFVRGFYAGVAAVLGDDPDFIDASRILDGREAADFYDIGHLGALSPPVVGELTAVLLLGSLQDGL